MTATLGEPARRFLDGEPFEADPFQIEAIRAIERGASVVVTAPTGSGKTLIAEAALEIALAAGRRAFYTAPIKALSNQKYRDLVARYGEKGTGLLTGDNTINGDAPVVVMTTEVLRNMIYAESDALGDLGVVILDEVHYLQDRYRGSVWEEIIIHLPEGIQLVNLSATIANPEEFSGWVAARRGPTDLIVETHRPVPLESMYVLRDRHHGNAVEWFPVFDRTGKRPNGQVLNLLRKGRGRRRRFATPRRLEVAETLLGAGKLPAIYFIFSRAGCEDAARGVSASGLRLTSADERRVIRSIAVEATAHLDPVDLSVLGYESWLAMLETGVAAHHAGMVPAFKETVEELFADGLVKLVFATETLSLGINMPAKAVVLEQFSKFNGESHELLRAGDYTQLTGRAGRRGIDDRGTALVLYSSYVPFEKVADVAGMGSHPLVSSFEPSYNMAVNLIANYPRNRAEELLRASFAQFRAQERVRQLEERIADKSRETTEFLEAARCDRGDIEAFAAAGAEGENADRAIREFYSGLDAGDVLDVGDGGRWVILARGYGKNPKFLLLSADVEERRRTAGSLGTAVLHLGRVDLDEPIRSTDPSYRAAVAERLRGWTASGDPRSPAGSVSDGGGVESCPNLDEHLQWLARSKRAAKDVRRLRRRTKRSGDDVVDRFRARMAVLERLGYAKAWGLSAKGQSLRRVYNELDLLLSESIERGLFDGLTVPEFAAVASLFTYEARARDPEAERLVGVSADRFESIEELWEEITTAEEQRRVPPTRAPEPGFAPYSYGWAAGADLEALYGDDDFSAGDFVRNCRQLLDLTRQIRDGFPRLAPAASAVITAVDRGIVAVGGRV
ncbi:MAG: DEAD/DEAH box helicase [Actinomycetota bacterium]